VSQVWSENFSGIEEAGEISNTLIGSVAEDGFEPPTHGLWFLASWTNDSSLHPLVR
jgi:hypothetical protein